MSVSFAPGQLGDTAGGETDYSSADGCKSSSETSSCSCGGADGVVALQDRMLAVSLAVWLVMVAGVCACFYVWLFRSDVFAAV